MPPSSSLSRRSTRSRRLRFFPGMCRKPFFFVQFACRRRQRRRIYILFSRQLRRATTTIAAGVLRPFDNHLTIAYIGYRQSHTLRIANRIHCVWPTSTQPSISTNAVKMPYVTYSASGGSLKVKIPFSWINLQTPG